MIAQCITHVIFVIGAILQIIAYLIMVLQEDEDDTLGHMVLLEDQNDTLGHTLVAQGGLSIVLPI